MLLRPRHQARGTAATPTTFNHPYTGKLKSILLGVNDCLVFLEWQNTLEDIKHVYSSAGSLQEAGQSQPSVGPTKLSLLPK